jgi:hypothetical protein
MNSYDSWFSPLGFPIRPAAGVGSGHAVFPLFSGLNSDRTDLTPGIVLTDMPDSFLRVRARTQFSQSDTR